MTETVTWSANAGSTGGSGINDSDKLEVDASMSSTIVIEPDTTAELTFQLSNVDKIQFLGLTCSDYSGAVSVQAGASDPDIVLTGPLYLFGDGVGLLGSSLNKLSVANTNTGDPETASITIDVLLGLDLL